MNDSLSRDLIYSLAGHLVVVVFIFFSAVLIPSQPIDLRQAIRVDVVGLPDKLPEQKLAPPKPEPESMKAPPKVEEAKAPKVSTKKADLSKSQQAALNQIKSMKALEKIKSQLNKEKEKNDNASTVVKGNQVNAGNSLTGLEKIEYDRYFDDLNVRIREHWNIPQWLADANLRAQVQVLIDERGYVVKKVFRRSSGNTVFDNSVLAAIDNSSPLPAPPARLRGLLATSGVIFNFPE